MHFCCFNFRIILDLEFVFLFSREKKNRSKFCSRLSLGVNEWISEWLTGNNEKIFNTHTHTPYTTERIENGLWVFWISIRKNTTRIRVENGILLLLFKMYTFLLCLCKEMCEYDSETQHSIAFQRNIMPCGSLDYKYHIVDLLRTTFPCGNDDDDYLTW